MNSQCHDNLKYLGPILNQIIVQWSNAARHNINGKSAPFFDRFLENIVPYVPFCNYRMLLLHSWICPGIIGKPISAYFEPILFALKLYWKPSFCDFFVRICPLFTIFCLLYYILHLYPPPLDYSLPIYLIISFSQNFNKKSNSFRRSPPHLCFRSDVSDTATNNLGDD